MAVRAFHAILYVADPYAERDFFGRFGFETGYEGDDFPGFLAVECGPVCFGLSNNSDLPQTVAHDGVVRLTSGPRLSYGYSISTGKSRVTTRVLHRVENWVFRHECGSPNGFELGFSF